MEKELLHKYFKGETFEEEEKLIMDWAEASAENLHAYLEERKLWNALLLHAAKPAGKKAPLVNFRTLVRYAALLITALTVGVYFLRTNQSAEPVSTSDILAPTLILDNKEQIALSNRSFAIRKGNARIENDNKNNKLSYQKQDEKAANKTNHLLIPHGQTYQVELSDGTLVTLNAESELVFPSQFEADRRCVTLRGEAFFRVARDESRPFVVETEQLSVQVLGTTFNVSCYSSDPIVRTTLVEGSVKVEQAGNSQIIRPSEQYQYNKETQKKSIEVVDTRLYTSWVNNEYIFRNATLEDIFTQLGHWYHFIPEYEQENLKNTHFTFTVSREVSLDQIIRLINNTDEVFIERTNHSIYIKHTKKHE